MPDTAAANAPAAMAPGAAPEGVADLLFVLSADQVRRPRVCAPPVQGVQATCWQERPMPTIAKPSSITPHVSEVCLPEHNVVSHVLSLHRPSSPMPIPCA